MAQRNLRSPFDRYMNALTRRLSRPVDFIACVDVDFTDVEQRRREANRAGCRISIAAIAAKAVSMGLSRYPLLMQVPGDATYFLSEEVRLAVPVDSKISDAYAVPITLVDAQRLPLDVLSDQLTQASDAIRAGEIGPFAFLLKIPSWLPVWPMAMIVALAARCSSAVKRTTFGVPILSITPLLREFALSTTVGGPILTLGAISPTVSWHDGRPVKKLVGKFICSMDHRVANARYVGRFLEHVRRAIEVDCVQEIQSLVTRESTDNRL